VLFRSKDNIGSATTLQDIEISMNSQLPSKPRSSDDTPWLQNLITLVILLFAIFASFFLFELTKAVAFAAVILVVTPVIMAFVQGAQTIKGKGLRDLYVLGLTQAFAAVKSIPKLFTRSGEKRPEDDPKDSLKNSHPVRALA